MKTSRTITTARIEYRYRRLVASGVRKWDAVDRLVESYGASAVDYWSCRFRITDLTYRELRAISRNG